MKIPEFVTKKTVALAVGAGAVATLGWLTVDKLKNRLSRETGKALSRWRHGTRATQPGIPQKGATLRHP